MYLIKNHKNRLIRFRYTTVSKFLEKIARAEDSTKIKVNTSYEQVVQMLLLSSSDLLSRIVKDFDRLRGNNIL